MLGLHVQETELEGANSFRVDGSCPIANEIDSVMGKIGGKCNRSLT